LTYLTGEAKFSCTQFSYAFGYSRTIEQLSRR